MGSMQMIKSAMSHAQHTCTGRRAGGGGVLIVRVRGEYITVQFNMIRSNVDDIRYPMWRVGS